MMQLLLRVGLALLLLFNAWMSPVLAETIEEIQILQVIRSHPKDILDSLIAYQQEQDSAQVEARIKVVRSVTENPRSLIANKAHEELNQFSKQYPDVQVVYKHLPLTQIHDQAMPAAKAAWAAGKQGKFWEYHDQLFANQQRLGDVLYQTIAQDLNLNVDQFNHDRASKSATAAIEADLHWADQLGATGTPFYVLVGPKDTQILTGASLKDLEATIEQV
jgi:protein-disulfide isomerase